MKIYCKNTKRRYLIDTGATISLLPKEANDKADPNYFLRAANGTRITTYGKETKSLELGLGTPMEHKFVKASVTEAILGADFVTKHGIIIDMKKGRITHGDTGIRRTLSESVSTNIYNVTEPHCAEAEEILARHPKLMYEPGEALEDPPNIGIEHEIDVRGSPPANRARRLNPRMLEAAKEHFEELLKKGVIEESTAPFASPLHIVPKKDGKFRFCGDYRGINSLTKPNKYSLPFIGDAVNNLSGKKVFSVLDIKEAFTHILVKKEHRDYTSIITPFGLYRYKRMPYGLSGASATYQRYMDHILRGLRRKNADGTESKVALFSYIDDLLVASENMEDHKRDLEAIMAKLEEHKMKLSVHKCKFFQEEINFLGFRLNQTGVSPTEEKVQVIKDYPMPKTLGEVKSFVGLIHFFHKHIKDAAEVMGPLHDLLRGYKKFKRGIKIDDKDPALVKSFNETKEALIHSTVLAYPSVTAEIALFCDASDHHVSGILQQREPDGDWEPLGFFSKKCTPREKGQSIFYRETLAIHRALKYFQYMIMGNDFSIYTDHLAICKALESNKQRDNAAETKMLNYINSWQRPVKHIKGSENFVADLFSRTEIEPEECNVISADLITREELIEEQAKTKEIKDIMKDRKMGLKLKKIDGVYSNIYKDIIRPYVPEPLRKKVFHGIHDMGHAGVERTLRTLRSRFVWYAMRKDVSNWVKSCKHCQVNKVYQHNKPPIDPVQVPRSKFRHVVADIVGPLIPSEGYQYIFTMICRYSGWIEAVPMREANVGTILDALINTWIARHGLMDGIQTDRGSVFTSQKFREAMQAFGIQHKFSCSYKPASQGIVERSHRVLKSSLRGENAHTWKRRLAFTLLSMRTSYSEGIQSCPASAVFGTSLRLPGELVDANIGEGKPPYSHAEQIRKEMSKVNFRAKNFKPQPGRVDPNLYKCDYVYIRSYNKKHSLSSLYSGPHKVIRRLEKYFMVQLDDKIDSIALHRLKSAVNPVPDREGDLDKESGIDSDSEAEDWSSANNGNNITANHNLGTNMPPQGVRSHPVSASNRISNRRGHHMTTRSRALDLRTLGNQTSLRTTRFGRITRVPNRYRSSR